MANQQKSDNITKVLETLWSTKGSSRAGIARAIRIDRSTVGAIAETLLNKNIAVEKSVSLSSGSTGRPPVIVQLNEFFAYAIGIEIAADLIHVTASGYCGNILFEEKIQGKFNSDNLEDLFISLITKTEKELKDKTQSGLQAVVIAVSGIVSREKGSILASSDLGIRREYVLAQTIEQAVSVPVWILNDADSCALGEQLYGDRTLKDFLFVLVNKRIESSYPSISAGLGIILDGNLREAHSGRGREFRSPLLTPDSTSQFLAAEQLLKKEKSPKQAWKNFTNELGLTLAFLVHALDIEHIILGGDAAGEDFDLFSERVSYHVNHNTGIYERVPVILRRPSAGPRPVAYGASAAAVKLLFQTRRFSIENIGV